MSVEAIMSPIFTLNENIPVSKAEGIVVYNRNLYIVSDLESTLYVFKIPN